MIIEKIVENGASAYYEKMLHFDNLFKAIQKMVFTFLIHITLSL